MFKSFKEIEKYLISSNIKKKIALAGAHDDDALSAVVSAKRKGIITAVLIGDKEKIIKILVGMNESVEDYEIISCQGESECANLACELVHQKKADIPMKGLMQTSSFMRAILNKEKGLLLERALLSQATVLEHRKEERLMIISDCAVNINPSYEERVKIIKNAVQLANKLGNDKPKVAIVSALESVNPAINSTIEAAMLSKAAERGQIKGCIVDGPLALDNAVSADAAKHKGIVSPVAGQADILIMPDLCAGNIFTKSLTFFAELPSSGTLNGTISPVIMTSRSDKPENKYYSILTAILQAL
ncbi:bifunctional enoyl-CoA hydratase/phosphate acetyltransferase [Clostridiaceae bacterium M8S5]|nr:bifunctional enoyl-CoA hydratase/phosphate acetyltransferase [Clostridiaceae bacterium M8S5]